MRFHRIILSLLIILFLISSCCPRKRKYKYVIKHCTTVKYQRFIELGQSRKLLIKRAKIRTYTKEGEFVKEYSLFDKYANWGNVTKNAKRLVFEKPLSTEFDWEIILNDSLHYYITDFKLVVDGGRTMFCENFGCAIKSYKVNGTVEHLIKDHHVTSLIYVFCKDHLIRP